MNKNHIKAITSIGICSCLLLGITFSANASDNSSTEIPIKYAGTSYSIDLDNPNIAIGDADYVFVGTIESLTNVEYKNPVTISTESGDIVVKSPYTNYMINVVENIKGELRQDIALPIQKAGGLSEDNTYYQVLEDDTLPEVGSTYIFSVYVQPQDGTMLVSGKNSNILLESATSTFRLDNSDIYTTYIEAAQNPTENDKQHFVSPYDINQ